MTYEVYLENRNIRSQLATFASKIDAEDYAKLKKSSLQSEESNISIEWRERHSISKDKPYVFIRETERR